VGVDGGVQFWKFRLGDEGWWGGDTQGGGVR